ncbi:MAG: glutamine--fructose-6-phosphate transaminase (isomerizing) [Pseudomonadota bacterium]
MCGIIGAIIKKPVQDTLLTGLSRLEYRGYDSAGIATLDQGHIHTLRRAGKLSGLIYATEQNALPGQTGIGHTRWATHGKPSEINAHPHTCGVVTLVHNGIIENYAELRDELTKQGYIFDSETDSEVAAALLAQTLAINKNIDTAVPKTLSRLRGAFSLAILIKGEDRTIIAARRGAPLALGRGAQGLFVASDAQCLSGMAQDVAYLEDDQWAILRENKITARNLEGATPELSFQPIDTAAQDLSKNGYPHFMLKEIYEQTETTAHLITRKLDFAPDFSHIDAMCAVACGTAYYSAMIGKYWIEQFAQLPVEVDLASEFRYRAHPMSERTLYGFISQSGETADTLAAAKYVQTFDRSLFSIVNVARSSLARLSPHCLLTGAGPEIGVASTKAFTSQLVALARLAIEAGRQRETIDAKTYRSLSKALRAVPEHIAAILAQREQILDLAQKISHAHDVLFIGRGTCYPLALEGALKLKEISYIHAEGYAAGELKHGPLALVDEGMPVIVLAPGDDLTDKTLANTQEVASRGGRVYILAGKNISKRAGQESFNVIPLIDDDSPFAVISLAIAVQLLAYETAKLKGADIDQPRNLAKSVTVE